jgi:hypothetical protein
MRKRGAFRAGNIILKSYLVASFEASYRFFFLKTGVQRGNREVNTATNKIIGI